MKTTDNQHNQSYRSYIQQAGLRKGEIIVHSKHFRLESLKTTTRCTNRNITIILPIRVTFILEVKYRSRKPEQPVA